MSRQTLQGEASHELLVKHSRFLAVAGPAGNPEAAAEFIARVSTPDATHNCWAWRIGGLYRSSDDGEPAGTAGRPILAAIDGQGLDETVVVVTRWYGGIKLGAGGLVRAYGGCAAECLRTAPRRTLIEYVHLRLAYPFEHTGAVHAALAQHGADKLSEDFAADGGSLLLRVPADAVGPLQLQLRDSTRGEVRVSDAPDDADGGQ